MRIREAVATDRAQLIELWTLTGLVRPWNDPGRDFDSALAGATSSVLVGHDPSDADDLLASAMVGNDGHRGWVYYLAVNPKRQRAGAGRQMMDAAERWLAESGAVKVQLMVRDSNSPALGFYDALGYQHEQTSVLSRWLDPDAARIRQSMSDRD